MPSTFYRPFLSAFNLLQLAGWGATENDTASDVLKWTTQKFVEYNKCRSSLRATDKKYLTQDKFCVAQVNGKIVFCERFKKKLNN